MDEGIADNSATPRGINQVKNPPSRGCAVLPACGPRYAFWCPFAPVDLSDRGADRTIRMELDSVPTIADPLLASSTSELLVAYNIFRGLDQGIVRRRGDPGGGAVAISQDETNTVYTFTLREAEWSDGEPVRAQDFGFGMRRAVDPSTKAKAASSLFRIHNAEQLCFGRASGQRPGGGSGRRPHAGHPPGPAHGQLSLPFVDQHDLSLPGGCIYRGGRTVRHDPKKHRV